MRDEASLRRLSEMGVDVYVPRVHAGVRVAVVAAARPGAEAPVQAEAAIPRAVSVASPSATAVLLIADAPAPGPNKLLGDVARALGFARVPSALAQANDATALAVASGLVMFGEAQARAAGAVLPAQRQQRIGWVVTGEAHALMGNAGAKRALWSELKRMTRALDPQR